MVSKNQIIGHAAGQFVQLPVTAKNDERQGGRRGIDHIITCLGIEYKEAVAARSQGNGDIVIAVASVQGSDGANYIIFRINSSAAMCTFHGDRIVAAASPDRDTVGEVTFGSSAVSDGCTSQPKDADIIVARIRD